VLILFDVVKVGFRSGLMLSLVVLMLALRPNGSFMGRVGVLSWIWHSQFLPYLSNINLLCF